MIDSDGRAFHKDSESGPNSKIMKNTNMTFLQDTTILFYHSRGRDLKKGCLFFQDLGVMMKTLGLLRNLLSHKSDIDHVMNLYGKQVMQAVVLILEGDNPVEVKEQALCILANIAGKLLLSGAN